MNIKNFIFIFTFFLLNNIFAIEKEQCEVHIHTNDSTFKLNDNKKLLEIPHISEFKKKHVNIKAKYSFFYVPCKNKVLDLIYNAFNEINLGRPIEHTIDIDGVLGINNLNWKEIDEAKEAAKCLKLDMIVKILDERIMNAKEIIKVVSDDGKSTYYCSICGVYDVYIYDYLNPRKLFHNGQAHLEYNDILKTRKIKIN